MSTHRNTWKARERQAAGLFGARRQVCSGSSGRDDRTRSDSTHPTLFLETKLRANQPVVGWFQSVERVARTQLCKIPILALSDGTGQTLWAVAPDDLTIIATPDFIRMRCHVGKKSASRLAVIDLFNATEKFAIKEGKTAVLALCQKGVSGMARS